jgi:hypothetical protein
VESLPLRVEISSLAREGEGVVSMDCALVNTSATQTVALGNTFAPEAGDSDTLAGVSLLQEAGPKRFYILRDHDGRAVCTGPIGEIGPGERRAVRAKFPAPGGDVGNLTVEFPGLPPFRNVPVSPAAGTVDR